MLKLGVKKGSQNDRNNCQNGASRGPQMIQNTKKRHAKMMPKFGVATKIQSNRPKIQIVQPWAIQGRFFGQCGGKGADFGPYLADFILNLTRRAPRQGAADFLDPFSDTGPPRVDLF